MTTTTNTDALSYWRETLPTLSKASRLEWKSPGPMGLRVWTGVLDGKPVARISRHPGHGASCAAAIDGWMWTEQMQCTAAARLGVKESQSRGFASVPEAKRAIQAATAAHG